MFTRIALASVVLGLLVACSGTPDAGEESPAVAEESTGKATQELRRAAATCECTLEAGDNVWRCNGACSDADLANLPH